MIDILAVVLEKIGESFLAALAGKATDEAWTKLKGDPAKAAFKRALGPAIQRYATSPLRLDLARPLLEKDGFLTLPTVAQELAQLVRFSASRMLNSSGKSGRHRWRIPHPGAISRLKV